MRSVFFELVYNVAMVTIAGRRGPVMDDMFGPSKILDACDYFPLLGWIDLLGIRRKMEALNSERDRFLQGLIDEVRCRNGDRVSVGGGERNYVDVLLSLQRSEPEYYTDEILKGLIMVSYSSEDYVCVIIVRLQFCPSLKFYKKDLVPLWGQFRLETFSGSLCSGSVTA